MARRMCFAGPRWLNVFTGIVETTGTISDTRSVAGGRSLRVNVGPMASDCSPGASLCVSGVCLTVVSVAGPVVTFDVIAETLAATVLGSRRPGDRVNLERSLRPSDRLDGHFVQGHVDGRAVVKRVVQTAEESILWLLPDEALTAYLIPKGSVAVDGVSLTIASVEKQVFSVALIPTTLERTTLSGLRAGDRVNIETDIIARTVVHSLAGMREGLGGLTLASLRNAGLA